jgi:hypothetical protein
LCHSWSESADFRLETAKWASSDWWIQLLIGLFLPVHESESSELWNLAKAKALDRDSWQAFDSRFFRFFLFTSWSESADFGVSGLNCWFGGFLLAKMPNLSRRSKLGT